MAEERAYCMAGHHAHLSPVPSMSKKIATDQQQCRQESRLDSPKIAVLSPSTHGVTEDAGPSVTVRILEFLVAAVILLASMWLGGAVLFFV